MQPLICKVLATIDVETFSTGAHLYEDLEALELTQVLQTGDLKAVSIASATSTAEPVLPPTAVVAKIGPSKAPLASSDIVKPEVDPKARLPALAEAEQTKEQEIREPVQKIEKNVNSPEKDSKRLNMFQYIYKSNMWGSGESKSGTGRELVHSSKHSIPVASSTKVDLPLPLPAAYVLYHIVQARKVVEFVIREFNIKTWVDAPCGDSNWQHHISNFAQINYTGLDIVPQAILDNSRKHMSDLPNARFANVDLVTATDLPYADLYLVRDAIQHLPLEDGMAIFRNIAASGAKYLLTNMHVRKSDGMPFSNKAVPPGGYYYNHPMLQPFEFPEPLYYIRDVDDHLLGNTSPSGSVKIMSLWKMDGTDLLRKGTGEAFTIDIDEARDIVRRDGTQ